MPRTECLTISLLRTIIALHGRTDVRVTALQGTLEAICEVIDRHCAPSRLPGGWDSTEEALRAPARTPDAA